MSNLRIPVYGKDAEGKLRRAFDLISIHGTPYFETKDRKGHRLIIPAADALQAIQQLSLQAD